MEISANIVEGRLNEIVDEQRRALGKISPYVSTVNDFDEAARLARHVLTGNPNDLSNRFERWGSWVHGIPLAQMLLRHELVLVDLYPIQEEQFPATYGVTRDQFWMLAQQGYLIVNIVNFDSDERDGFKAHKKCANSIGPILLDPAVEIRIVSQSRKPIFAAISGDDNALLNNYNEASEKFRIAAEKFHKFARANPNDPVSLKAEYRGNPPHPEKILWNWAYWRTAIPVIGEKSDPVLEAISNQDARYDLYDALVFSDFAQRLTYIHHTYTAPLTGAFGGTYNMDPRQAQVMSEIIEEKGSDFDPADAKRPFHNKIAPDFLRYLNNVATGKIKADASDVSGDPSSFTFLAHKSASQVMNDVEFIDFLDFLRFNRDTLRRQNILMTTIANAKNDKKTDLSYEAVIGAMQDAKRKSTGLLQKYLPKLMVGVGTEVLGASIVFGLPVSFLISVFGETLFEGKGYDRICSCFNNHHREIISFQDDWRFTK